MSSVRSRSCLVWCYVPLRGQQAIIILHLIIFSAFCEEEDGFYDRTGHYDWPATKSGVTASILCSYDPRDAYLVSLYKPRAVRECTATPDGRAYWKPPDTSQCKEVRLSYLE